MYRKTGNRKYDEARTVLRYVPTVVTDYRAATIYPALEAAGFWWDTEAARWVRSEAEAQRYRRQSAFMRDLHAELKAVR